MRIKLGTFSIMILGTMFLLGTAFAQTKTTYTGSGTYQANTLTLDLGNGATVFRAENEGVVSISTSPPTILFSKCMGLGITNPNSSFETDFYCTFEEDNLNSFAIKGHSTDKGGDGKIIGGSGKWKGATGTMTLTGRQVNGNRGKYTFKMTVTTP